MYKFLLYDTVNYLLPRARWQVRIHEYSLLSYMPIGILGIYRLLFVCLFVYLCVCLFVCLFLSVRGILVTDISGVGWHRAMKLCRVVDLRVHQVISPFGELHDPGVSLQVKMWKNFGNAYRHPIRRSLARCDKLTGQPQTVTASVVNYLWWRRSACGDIRQSG